MGVEALKEEYLRDKHLVQVPKVEWWKYRVVSYPQITRFGQQGPTWHGPIDQLFALIDFRFACEI